jgi:hypothetical protein
MRPSIGVDDARLMVLFEQQRDLARTLEDVDAAAGPRLRGRATHAEFEILSDFAGQHMFFA